MFIFLESESESTNYKDVIFISAGLAVKTISQNDSIHEYKQAVYKLNIESSKWEKNSVLKSARRKHQSTIIGDKMYLVGGIKRRSRLADTEIISISKNDETLIPRIPSMHNRRSSFGMCTFARCIFVAGGKCNRVESLDKCEFYSTVCGEWIEASSMNTKRSRFALIYFQDKIWAVGGDSNKTYLDTIETYSLADNKWTTLDTKLLSKRCGHSAVVHNKKIFVIGGFYNKPLSSVEVYSSETKQFSFVSQMGQARYHFGYSTINNRLIVFGGYSKETEITDSVEVYDNEKQVWSKCSNLPRPIAAFGYATMN